MLKMYFQRENSGSTPEFWDETWDKSSFDNAFKGISNNLDPLNSLFDYYLNEGDLMLEGGCGLGQYIAYYSKRGVNVVGLDFAQNTLLRLNEHCPDLMLCAGNVASLPFKDGTFDIYYSGGVVEHFEGGCSEALQEARRVLQPNGKLLISVPYYSPLRRILYYRRKNWRRVGGPSLDNTNNDSLVFFQYAYTISEFKKQLSSAGLNVLAVQGYSLLWGLRDLNWVNKAMCLLENRSKGNSISKEEMIKDSPSINGDHKPSLLKRFLLSESPNTSLGKFCLRGMLLLCANMMMFICVPAKNE